MTRHFRLVSACTMILAGACNGYDPSSAQQSLTVAAVAGGGKDMTLMLEAQRWDSLAVTVRDQNGTPAAGVSVQWASADPLDRFIPASSTTDANGVAWTKWGVSGVPGTHTATAAVDNGTPATFDFTLRSWSAKAMYGRLCGIGHDGRLACKSGDVLRYQVSAQRFTDIEGHRLRSCALSTTGRIWCSTNVGVEPFTELAGAYPAFATFAGHNGTYCAIDGAGALWCWGGGEDGLRADGASSNTTVTAPVKAHDGPFTDLAMGSAAACALASDGTPWCWGRNLSGVVLPGSAFDGAVYLPAPVAVPRPLSTVVIPPNGIAACGRGQAQVVCWGPRSVAGLGDGGGHATPTAIGPGLDFAVLAHAGFDGFVAQTITGETLVWGTAWYGHLPSSSIPVPSPTAGALKFRAMYSGSSLESGRTVCGDLSDGSGTICQLNAEALWPTAGNSGAAWLGLPVPLPEQ